MTLKDIDTYLASLPWVGSVLAHEDVSNPEDVKAYGISNIHVHILEKSGMVAKKRKIFCYVRDMGTEREEVFFDGGLPVPELRPQTVTEYGTNADGTLYPISKVVSLDGTSKILVASKTETIATKTVV